MFTNVLEYLEASAARYPDKAVFVDENISLTYLQALTASRAIGSCLARSAAPRSPIAVLMHKGALAPVCFLGIVYGGCFYVPLDPQLPEERLGAILALLKPAAILADAEHAGLARSLAPTTDLLPVEAAMTGTPDEALLADIRAQAIDTDPLYALFTSGSTGIPKGVVQSHRAVFNCIEQYTETFQVCEADVIGNQAPFDFSISVKDIYAALKCGAMLCIIPRQYFSFPGKLVEFLNRYKVTMIFWAVSAVVIAANLKAFEKQVPHHLTRVLFSGEVMPVKHLNYWCSYLPDVTFASLYSSTEITCNCAYHIVERDLPPDTALPIGRPFRNRQIILLNERDELVQGDEIGELCVLGGCLALGYYNSPEQTARAFVQNPLNSQYPEIMYRSGDLARYNAAGELVYCGRKDSQIKHQGHRIELGEIETAVNAIEGVLACCCLYDAVHKQIYLLYESEAVDKATIGQVLHRKLPRYMWPRQILALDKMPYNRNGKIDRASLQEEYIREARD